MGDYIERKRVIALITDRYERPEIREQEINDIPAADVRPVVRGRWEWMVPCGCSGGILWATCSACGERQRLGDFANFCPNCGADMGGE